MTDKPEPTKSRQEVLDDALFNMTGTGNIEAVRELVKKGGILIINISQLHLIVISFF